MGETFADIIFNGQFLIAGPIAVLAGLVSFASPCVLPLVPGYLAYVGGITTGNQSDSRRRVVAGASLFVLGFALVFTVYGAAFGALGGWLIRFQDPVSRGMGLVLIVMGVVFIGALPWFQRTIRIPTRPAVGLFGAPVLGVVFGLGWTPCLGPTLAAISALSINSASPWRGTALAFLYCLGLGVPFLLLALGWGRATWGIGWLRRHVRAINIAGGIGLVIIGALMASGLWTLWLYDLQSVIGGFVLPI